MSTPLRNHKPKCPNSVLLVFSPQNVMWLTSDTRSIRSWCVQICYAALILSHTGHWKFQQGTIWQRTLWDVLLCCMKMAKTARKLPTPWNWAAAQWLRSSSVWKERGQLRTSLGYVVQRSWTHVLSVTSKCFLWKIGVEELSALLQWLKWWGVSLLVLRPYTALYIKLVCMAVTPGGSLFWRWFTRTSANSFTKTCQQSTWITGPMSYDLMRLRLICLVPMASSMCGSDQVRSTKISVSCLHSSMVVGMSWPGAAWVLQVLESYISLRETWTPTCTVKYCSRAWSPLSRNWVTGVCSSMTMTPNTPRRWPLLYWSGWE